LPLVVRSAPPVTSLELTTEPSSIAADGISTSTVTALVKGADSNPLGGVSVTFTATLGTLSHLLRMSGPEGTASVVLTSAINSGLSTVRAVADSITRTTEVTFTTSPTPEVRALWVTRYGYSSPEDVARIVERAAYAHFNTILFQVRGQSDAYYQSQHEPWAARLTGTITETLGQDPGWDPLAVALDEVQPRGLQLHAWINVYPAWVGTSPPPTDTSPLHMYHVLTAVYTDTWRQWDEHGPMPLNPSYLWASPAVTLTVEPIISVCQDIVGRYDVDGLHLDHIRYAGPGYSHDPVSQARFSETLAISPTITWEDWQRAQVTELVDRIYREVISPRSDVMLTAAVWPIYQDRWDWIKYDGYDGYYQDSQGWMQEGQIDGIAPMLYAYMSCMGGEEYYSRFYTLTQDFVEHDNDRFVLAGIYAGTDDGMSHYDDFEDVADSIDRARQAGVAGQAIFQYRLVEERGYWDEFREGPYQQPALLPAME
ncbi:MAG: family 10 glycosylhydrolase, partial [Chloroflexota bacterium]|nr:family 10 glycosylhydrolase [Chloroflexota bacterium]